MAEMFKGVSHAVVFFNSINGQKESGISAMVKICFGSDDDAIAQVLYCTTPGSKAPAWTLPSRSSIGATVSHFPVFTGKVGEEILGIVGRAADKVKKAGITGILAGRVFRVSSKGVEEVKPQTTTNAPTATTNTK